jgi:crossover junction endodeoxyribonuclease RusA
MTISFTVSGITPAPQGSKRHLGHGVLVEASTRVKPWRQAVTTAALEARRAAGLHGLVEGPCSVSVVFSFQRPRSHYGRRGLRPGAPLWKASRPDLDKLTRSTLDGLSQALIRDDAQVVTLTAAKRYCGEDEVPGCLIPHGDGA